MRTILRRFLILSRISQNARERSFTSFSSCSPNLLHLPSVSRRYFGKRRSTVRPCTRSLENAMISDPNIPETGEQAARALHNIDDSECCFHVCAKDAPISGICTNCEEPWRQGRLQDPWTAPQCDTAALQSGPTGKFHESLVSLAIN